MAAVTMASCHVSASSSLSRGKKQNGGRHNGLVPRVCILLAFYRKETKWRLSQWPRATCLHPPRFLEERNKMEAVTMALCRVSASSSLSREKKKNGGRHKASCHVSASSSLSREKKQNGGRHNGLVPHVCILLAF
jgi:hypothetical protein